MEDLTLNEFKEAFIEIIIMFSLCILVLLFIIGIYILGTEDGEKDSINKLCRRYEYDFCEPIIVNTTIYRLKEIEND